MRTINKDQLAEIVKTHGRWLRGEEGGEKADLSNVELLVGRVRLDIK